MQSVMNHSFARVPKADIPRSVFDRSHGYKTTLDSGYLVPFFVDEALPGDTFNLKANFFGRLATPIKPIMDNIFLDTFYFAVPKRLVWNHWQAFCGEQRDPDDVTDYLVPQVTSEEGGWTVQSVADYFGIPTEVDMSVNALPFRAYNLIIQEWFRDQNLQQMLDLENGDGPDNYAQYPLQKRCKKHDYFTSCLPWPQKGPDVLLPLGGQADVSGIAPFRFTDGVQNFHFAQSSSFSPPQPVFDVSALQDPIGTGISTLVYPSASGKVLGINVPAGGLYADLETATATTINNLREAFQIQRLFERDARGGTRYVEILKSHFGVSSPDFRLQRPEFLGSSSQRLNINPVQQTGATVYDGLDVESAQGNLAGYGVISSQSGFSKSFVEHSYIIGLMNVRTDLTYQQGLNRMWSRQRRFDFYWPALAHLGEQEVLSKEIYCDGTENDELVFGYQERFAEYRYKPSQITGKFRSNYAQSLDIWHLAEDFGTRPELNSTFIKDSSETQIDRVIAVPTEPQFLMDVYLSMKCARPMPVYSVPGLIDHF